MTSLFPVTCSDDVRADRDFYTNLLGMKVAFENEWYVQLQHPSDPTVQLGFVEREHPSVPEGYRARPRGVIVTVERDDVDDIHGRAASMNLPILLPLRDEPWGQRHFMTRDPSGVVVDVVKLIPPAAEYAAGYTQGA